MQFHNLILVGREVQRGFPAKISTQHRSRVQCHFPPPVLDISGIHIPISVHISCQCREFEELVIGIISQVNSQTMLKESPFRSKLYGMCHFRLHLPERSGIIRLYLTTGIDMRRGVGNMCRNIIAYLTVSAAQFCERNPSGHLHPFVE